MSVVGFDVGDSKACVAVARRNGVDVLLNKESKRETPTVVSFGTKQRALGCDGATSQSSNPKNTVFGIKRIIGRKFAEPGVQEELKYLPFTVLEGPDGGCLIEVTFLGEKLQLSPERVMAMVLTDLKTIAEGEMEGTKVTDCVVSCPNYFSERERCAMLDAVEIAGLNCLRLIPDTTSSALSYGIYKTDLSETEPLNVAFVDVGHAALQVCIAAFKKGSLKILAQTFDRSLGGRSFDNLLFEHFCEEIKEKYKLDIKSHARATLRLRKELTRVKKILTANSQASFAIECLMEDTDVKGMITRDDFEALAASLLGKLEKPLEDAMVQSGLSLDDVATIELIGSGSRVPVVASLVAKFFGKDVSRTINISECVSRGCALQCAMLSPVFRVRDFQVQDLNVYPINFAWKKDDGTTTTSAVFPKGNAIPSVKMLTFLRSEPFALECSYADDAGLPERSDPAIGTYEVGPIKVPSGEEKAKLKVQVRLSLHGTVDVDSVSMLREEEYEVEVLPEKAVAKPEAKAEEKDTADAEMQDDSGAQNGENGASGEMEASEAVPEAEEPAQPRKEIRKRTLKTDVNLQSKTLRMRGALLNESHAKELKMRESDALEEATKEARNSLEAYILSTRSKLYDAWNDYVAEEARSTFANALDKMEDWMYEDGEDETREVYNAKLAGLKGTGDPIEERYLEVGKRGPAAQALRTACASFAGVASSQDGRYAHLNDDERARVSKECQAALQWLDEKQAIQESMPKDAPPALMSFDITKKLEVVERVCKPIVTKPAPAPKPEPKEAATKEEAEPMQTEEDCGKDDKGCQQGCCGGKDESTPMDASDDLD